MPWQDLHEFAYGNVSATAQMTVLGVQPRIDVFYLGTSNHIYDKAWINPSGWQPSTDLGAPQLGLTARSVAATWWMGNSRLDVYIVGNDQHLYQDCFNCGGTSGWRGWLGLGETLNSPPSVTAYPSAVGGIDRIDVFFLSSDNNVYQKTWTTTTNWVTVPLGAPGSNFLAPAGAWWQGDYRIDAMATSASTGHIMHNCFPCPSTWRGWLDDLNPDVLNSGPTVAHT
jgi:hypothetical protein